MQSENAPANPTDIGDDFNELAYGSQPWSKRAARRAVFFERTFDSLNERIVATLGIDGLFLNAFVNLSVVESYFLDIARLKAFHDIKVADRYKIGSYSTKWLMRLRPVQFKPAGARYNDRQNRLLLLVNAQYALMVASSICKFDLDSMPQKWRENLLYTLHYRDLEPGILAQFYRLAAATWPTTQGGAAAADQLA